MTYGAITIDTSVFDRYKCRLETGLLAELAQFHGKPTGMILSEIVAREVVAHLEKITQDSISQIESTLKICAADLVVQEEILEQAKKLLIPEKSVREIVRDRLQKFVDKTGGTIVHVEDNTSLQAVIVRYFGNQAPFSESGKKKNEFPDALALLSLEGWAEANGTKILAVSTDGDWKRFAEQSEDIDVIEDLASALSLFQPDNDALRFCQTLAELLDDEPQHPLSEAILNAVSDQVSTISPIAYADGPFPVEADYVHLHVDQIQVLDEGEVVPVQAQEGSLALQASFWVSITAECSLDFLMKDPIDNDYVPMGSGGATTEMELEIDALVQLVGDFSGDPSGVAVDGAEVLTEINSVDFGYVEPSWMHEPDA